MDTITNLIERISKLEPLLLSLKDAPYCDKLSILNELPIVKEYVSQEGPIQNFLKLLTPEAEFVIKSVIAIDQAPIVFNILNLNEDLFRKLVKLLEQLLSFELFYAAEGGIIGYYVTILKLIVEQLAPKAPSLDHTHYIHPKGLDLGEETSEVRQAVRWGLENLQKMAVIYPMGGAGDRLDLKDEKTGNPLPAALLPFLGRTLLEGLLRDLQAEEYLFFKLFGKQLLTPIAIMTSVEKNNHIHILNICKNCDWFGRPSSSFHFFIQPSVPVITVEGNWSTSAPLTLTLKPCGHGVLWKLAEEKGVFEWLASKKRDQCLIRQINNPLAGIDQALFALIGMGCHKRKTFGFLSCERLLNSDEGTDVLIETETKQGYDYSLTNIEYTEFAKRGIKEVPIEPSSPFSIYPANTNILFAHLPSIRKLVKTRPIPGQLINMKSKVPYIDAKGSLSHVTGGRLESTMQNIADYMIDHFPQRLTEKEYEDALQSFILYNPRSKTISTTKKSYQAGQSPLATPEQAFYDLLTHHYFLLKQCQFELPPWKTIEEYLKEGPSCVFIFHPALGPLYSIISQKIRKGRLGNQAELQLEIAEVDIEDLTIEGSLLIQATSPLGIHDGSHLQYGKESRCSLKQVSIQNRGIHRQIEQKYWKNSLIREEQVEVILHEGAEFHAESITLEGSHRFIVPAHHRLVLSPDAKNKWKKKLSPIENSTWYWQYSFDSQNAIQLKKMY